MSKDKKEEEIVKYSNPEFVFNKFKQSYNGDIKLSTRKDKKYMAFLKGKWVHFGQMGYPDYTKTLDDKKRSLFRSRNRKWEEADKYSPAFLSFNLLW